ncbi:MAG: Coenzyme F420 hydrogenase/dehydrogenase, beta subunit C-terminal domain, partial [Candidatus Bathyarchaeia archaeon]
SFNPKKLREQIKNILNVDIDKASRTQVYGNKFIVTVDGKDFSCDIEKLESAIENGCSYCNDFVANFADIAVGTAGSESPYYTVIVRTEKGVALLEKTPLTKTSVMKDDIVKLSEFKKNRAKDHIEPILREVHAQRSKEKKVN